MLPKSTSYNREYDEESSHDEQPPENRVRQVIKKPAEQQVRTGQGEWIDDL